MNSYQLGLFSMCEDMVRDHPEIVAAAFKDMEFVAVRAELFYVDRKIKYQGISSKFDKINQGNLMPEYRVTISTTDITGKVKYSGVEVERL